MKTLYLSDLDGTLLRPNQRTSAYTNSVINRLARSGVLFSYATARSVETAAKVTRGIQVRLPVIVHNGVFVMDSRTRETIWSLKFSEVETAHIFGVFLRAGLIPITYAVLEGRQRFSFWKSRCSRAQWEFVLSRIKGKRKREVFSEEEMCAGEVYYFACIDGEDKLRPVYETLKNDYRCEFSRDIYSGETWLEIMPKEASKARAALVVKEMFGCDRLVCFGDAVNDIPMFELADECYAVGNAAEELKKIATAVIGTNSEDGVAKWLDCNLSGNL